MSADERRELVLAAASRAFARSGYAGTSTDAVAREAGVSQPYVVRIFGTKLELFLEVFERAATRIRTAFEDVLDAGPFDPESDEDWARMGLAYSELLARPRPAPGDDARLLGGGVDEIAAAARRCMGDVFATIKRTGCDDEQGPRLRRPRDAAQRDALDARARAPASRASRSPRSLPAPSATPCSAARDRLTSRPRRIVTLGPMTTSTWFRRPDDHTVRPRCGAAAAHADLPPGCPRTPARRCRPTSPNSSAGRAGRARPKAWAYVAGGAGEGRTMRRNRAAFDRWAIVPRMAAGRGRPRPVGRAARPTARHPGAARPGRAPAR